MLYNVVHPESEYWTNNSGAVATTAAAAAPMYDASGFPIPINQSYMVMNEHEMVPYQYMNSNGAMIGMIPPSPTTTATTTTNCHGISKHVETTTTTAAAATTTFFYND